MRFRCWMNEFGLIHFNWLKIGWVALQQFFFQVINNWDIIIQCLFMQHAHVTPDGRFFSAFAFPPALSSYSLCAVVVFFFVLFGLIFSFSSSIINLMLIRWDLQRYRNCARFIRLVVLFFCVRWNLVENSREWMYVGFCVSVCVFNACSLRSYQKIERSAQSENEMSEVKSRVEDWVQSKEKRVEETRNWRA